MSKLLMSMIGNKKPRREVTEQDKEVVMAAFNRLGIVKKRKKFVDDNLVYSSALIGNGSKKLVIK